MPKSTPAPISETVSAADIQEDLECSHRWAVTVIRSLKGAKKLNPKRRTSAWVAPRESYEEFKKKNERAKAEKAKARS